MTWTQWSRAWCLLAEGDYDQAVAWRHLSDVALHSETRDVWRLGALCSRGRTARPAHAQEGPYRDMDTPSSRVSPLPSDDSGETLG